MTRLRHNSYILYLHSTLIVPNVKILNRPFHHLAHFFFSWRSTPGNPPQYATYDPDTGGNVVVVTNILRYYNKCMLI
jgi:hypothetical protein